MAGQGILRTENLFRLLTLSFHENEFVFLSLTEKRIHALGFQCCNVAALHAHFIPIKGYTTLFRLCLYHYSLSFFKFQLFFQYYNNNNFHPVEIISK